MSWTVGVLAVAVLTPAVWSQGAPLGGLFDWEALRAWALSQAQDRLDHGGPKPPNLPQISTPKLSEYRLWTDLFSSRKRPHSGDTRDRICVYGTNKESGREMSHCSNGLQPDLDNAKSPWISLNSMRLDRDIIIKTTGSDGAWIDRFEIYERIKHSDGAVELKTTRAYGAHNTDGYCLSRDAYDYIGIVRFNYVSVPARRCYPELILKPNGVVAAPAVPTPAPRPTHYWDKPGFGGGWNGLGRRLQRPEAEAEEGNVATHLVAPVPAKEKNSS